MIGMPASLPTTAASLLSTIFTRCLELLGAKCSFRHEAADMTSRTAFEMRNANVGVT